MSEPTGGPGSGGPGSRGSGDGPTAPLNLRDFEALARSKMARMAYDYYASGADDEITLGDNSAAFRRLRLAYRVLVDVSRRDAATRLLGVPLAMPVVVAPTAYHGLAHPEGEVATARAAGAAGTLMILSTLSNRPVEEVTAAASGPVWFQLYVYKDRGASEALIRRVEAAGCQAIVLTVDAPILGRRERDERNRFHLPPGLTMANLYGAEAGKIRQPEGGSGLAVWVRTMLDASLSWRDLEWLSGVTDLPVLVKGIVRPDDAARAVEHGAAGIVISNHGGRQLDTAPATIDVLPAIAEELDRRGAGRDSEFALLLDGGVRRGTDVVKALALGARAVLVGRPVLWGLAADGQAGVERVLAMLAAELDTAMALCGATCLAELTPDLVLR
jgi:4-hydroxymandelate oxidase